MNYLVIKGNGWFAADAKARNFTASIGNAWKFTESSDAYHVAKMLRLKDADVRAVSERAYLEDIALDSEP